MTAWSVVRFLHVLGAIGWVGGQLTLSAVVVPVVRARVPLVLDRAALMHDAGRRYARLTNVVLLPLLAATGLALAGHRRIDVTSLADTTYGRLFTAKLIFVVASLVLAGAHGVVAGRRPTASRGLAIAGLSAAAGVVLFATALVP